ncbi:hypothetical protein Tco_1173215 [Tanacetum coccineum]
MQHHRLQVLRETEFILFAGVAHNKMLTKFSSGAYRKRAFNCKSKFVTEREEAGRCNFSVKPLKSKRRGSEKNGSKMAHPVKKLTDRKGISRLGNMQNKD